MSDIAIRCEGLSKQYRIGKRESYKALRDVLANSISAPFRAVRSAFNRQLSLSSDGDNMIWALKDVFFEVKQGEVIGIIGRNGAGKSTLLKILSRITEPTKGHADIHGRVGSLLEVGTGFNPELTGRENIYLNGAILGMKKAEIVRRFDEIVAFAEIDKFLDTPVKYYSSGMYMRLAFAVAAHLEPEILLVDEVLAVGDVAFQKKCLGKMEAVAKAGRTVLFVSHNMNAIEELCQSIIVLDQGRIQESGTAVRSIINRYMSGAAQEVSGNTWTNTGEAYQNAWFTPTEFSITDENGQSLETPVRNDAQMWVQIKGVVHQLDQAMNMGYALYAEDGHLLYWSLTTDGAEADWPQFQTGPCVVRSQIPKRFLNEGDYRLDLIVSLHYRSWLVQPGVNAPSLFLSIRGGLSDSPYWMMPRPGIMGPSLPWAYCTDLVSPSLVNANTYEN